MGRAGSVGAKGMDAEWRREKGWRREKTGRCGKVREEYVRYNYVITEVERANHSVNTKF
jgi:hypothetical protein